jgi:hypothetical protein
MPEHLVSSNRWKILFLFGQRASAQLSIWTNPVKSSKILKENLHRVGGATMSFQLSRKKKSSRRHSWESRIFLISKNPQEHQYVSNKYNIQPRERFCDIVYDSDKPRQRETRLSNISWQIILLTLSVSKMYISRPWMYKEVRN